jgi:hypothetical protein
MIKLGVDVLNETQIQELPNNCVSDNCYTSMSAWI